MTTKLTLQRELDAARATVGDLMGARHQLEQLAQAREAELADISYAALVEGNAAAKKRLAELHHQAATEASEIAACDAALAEARRRYTAVEQKVRGAAERQRVDAVLAHADQFAAHGAELDAFMEQLVRTVGAFAASRRAIVKLGVETPTALTLEAFVKRCFNTATRGTAVNFEFISGNLRMNFSELGGAWKKLYSGWAKAQLRALGIT